MVERKERK
jgi:hypothetical protein